MERYQQFSPSGPIDLLLERLSNPRPAGRDRWTSACPAHGSGRNQALSIRLEGDRVLLHCFAGCESQDILEALGFDGWADLYRGTEHPYSPPVRAMPVQIPDQNQQTKLERLWQSGRPVHQGDTVSRYLQGRGLRIESFSTVLRYHPALEHWNIPEDQTKPQLLELLGAYSAMLARVEHSKHGLVAIHRTYLEPDGSGKAKVPSPKKLTRPVFAGAVNGAAIRLYPTAERLALAEGIETALAVHLATGWPVWACISAGGLARVAIPPTVHEVLVAADHDQAGLEAAHALAHRLVAGGIRVRIATPPRPGTDWLDVWRAEKKVVGNEH